MRSPPRTAPAGPRRGPSRRPYPGPGGGGGDRGGGARLEWARSFDAAIVSAGAGVPLAHGVWNAVAWRAEASDAPAGVKRHHTFAADPGLRPTFFGHDGAPLPEGALLVQPALASTLKILAADGPDSFYGGGLGRRYALGLRG